MEMACADISSSLARNGLHRADPRFHRVVPLSLMPVPRFRSGRTSRMSPSPHCLTTIRIAGQRPLELPVVSLLGEWRLQFSG